MFVHVSNFCEEYAGDGQSWLLGEDLLIERQEEG